MKHTISALVENNSGVLARVAGLFARRGYNINSLAVGETDDASVSRITVVSDGSSETLEQIEKQVNKLTEVIRVKSIPPEANLCRELVLVKVRYEKRQLSEIVTIADLEKGKISDITPDSVIIELSGSEKKINTFISLISPYGIIELARTGAIALERGKSKLSD